MFQNQKGFTLVELLVAIGIIGILATVTTVSVSSIRAKGRDTKRVTDVKAIQSNLEIFAETNGGYPNPATKASIEGLWMCNGDKAAAFKDDTGCVAANRIFRVPKNPAPGGGKYAYTGDASFQTYKLFFRLEGDSASFKKGCNVATDKEITTTPEADCLAP
ncbi:MAG: prepilin-type N-terminal cleavage/methylation domain-containing protein [bacterium]|nr:prepilin-type N-terminal cleavage/methylation domain-containing protein [bacterium]